MPVLAVAATGLKPSEIFSNRAWAFCAYYYPTVLISLGVDSCAAVLFEGVYGSFMNIFLMALLSSYFRLLSELSASGYDSSYLSTCLVNNATIWSGDIWAAPEKESYPSARKGCELRTLDSQLVDCSFSSFDRLLATMLKGLNTADCVRLLPNGVVFSVTASSFSSF